MGSAKVKTVDMSISIEDAVTNDADTEQAEVVSKKRVKHGRSRKYKSVRGMVDKTMFYPLEKALETLKKVSYSNFNGTLTADAVVKDNKLQVETTFPHATGKTRKIAIADEKLLKEIEAGNIDFDVLLAKPEMMSKIAKHARVLGPKGLMPNPKTGTVTADPEARKKELEAGKIVIKAERKFPLIHVTLGKINQPTEELVANVTHLIKTVGPRKITKLTISSTMSPGIKVDLSQFIEAK